MNGWKNVLPINRLQFIPTHFAALTPLLLLLMAVVLAPPLTSIESKI